MTKEEWKEVQDKWSNPFEHFNFKIDGFDVLVVPQMHKLRLVHAIYVNGWIKGSWMNENCEEGRRFYRVIEKYFWSPKIRKEAVKQLGKRAAKQYNKKYRYVYPEWVSFASFKRHLTANNKDIQLVRNESLDFGQENK